jgi:hypothetical protein
MGYCDEVTKTEKIVPIHYINEFSREFKKTIKGPHGIEYAIITECPCQCPFHEVNHEEDYPYCRITLNDVYDEVHYNIVGENCPLKDLASLNCEME